jgi:DNA (cytosine-5)-methyltransferase 1
MKEINFRLGELFCGPGGLAWGAVHSSVERKDAVYKIKHEWASDYDNDACETYRRNIAVCDHESVICEDVRDLKIQSLPQIDAFVYGFPCNDFSLVGEQRGFDGKFGPLYTYGIKVINLFKPKFFVAENVGGIRSANNGLAFKKILGDLENAGNGYSLSVNLYKCEEYGVPQSRHRVVIVGIDKKFNLQYRVPAPFTKQKPITAREALENPPIPKGAANQELTAQSENVVERLKCIQPGQNAWTADLPERLKLNVKGAKMSQIYRRLHPDFPAYTITGSGGGGTHVYHWEKPRALTNRERARLQTFPDNFVFEGSKESVRRQIGMGVPPRMSQIIFTAVLKTFAAVPYQNIEENLNGLTDLLTSENISNKELCRL